MKLIDETIKNPKTGQYSRKNLTAILSFVFAMAYSAVGMLLDKQVHEFVVWGFLSLTGALLGVSSWEKKNLPERQKPEQQEQELS